MRNTGILQHLLDHRPQTITQMATHLDLPEYGITVLLESGFDTGLVDEDGDTHAQN